MRKTLSTPAILLLALSLGLWLGASWHVAGAKVTASGTLCCANCIDGATLLQALRRPQKSPRLCEKKSPPPAARACAFCLAGMLVQDAPPASVTVAHFERTKTPESTAQIYAAPQRISVIQPPQRGPPCI